MIDDIFPLLYCFQCPFESSMFQNFVYSCVSFVASSMKVFSLLFLQKISQRKYRLIWLCECELRSKTFDGFLDVGISIRGNGECCFIDHRNQSLVDLWQQRTNRYKILFQRIFSAKKRQIKPTFTLMGQLRLSTLAS